MTFPRYMFNPAGNRVDDSDDCGIPRAYPCIRTPFGLNFPARQALSLETGVHGIDRDDVAFFVVPSGSTDGR